MRIPDYNKMRIKLSDDVDSDYWAMSDEVILYLYVKIFGNTVPTKEKE